MTVKSINLWLILGVALLWQPLSASAFIYSAEAIEGWVVDAGTDKPIEGVIVVAHWQLKGGFEGGNPVGELQIIEAVTDQNGRYYFPSWGPKFAWSGYLKSESPEILMFKPGYKYLGVSNRWYRDRDTSKSDWNGKTVKLEPFKRTLEEYARHLGRLSDLLWRIGHAWAEPCGWKSFPRMILALDAQDAEFRRAGINYGSVASTLRSNDSHLRAAGCGSIEEILKP